MTEAPSLRYGTADCTVKNTQVTLVRITASNAASVVPPIGVSPEMPALANRMSSLPNLSAACRLPLGRGDIGGVGNDRLRVRPEFRESGIQRRLIAPGDGDPRALGHEQPRGRKPMPLLPPVINAVLFASRIGSPSTLVASLNYLADLALLVA